MTDDKVRTPVPRGFSGIKSLVSNIDVHHIDGTETNQDEVEAPNADLLDRGEEDKPGKREAQVANAPEDHATSTSSNTPSAVVLVVLTVALTFIGVVWWIDAGMPTDFSSAVQSKESRPNSTRPESRPSKPQSPTPAPKTLVEVRPPIGDDFTLNLQQIQYCLAEDIRLDGARPALNNYDSREVNRFNAMVSDYNSRCGSFRYFESTMVRARRTVESFRSRLLVDGRNRF